MLQISSLLLPPTTLLPPVDDFSLSNSSLSLHISEFCSVLKKNLQAICSLSALPFDLLSNPLPNISSSLHEDFIRLYSLGVDMVKYLQAKLIQHNTLQLFPKAILALDKPQEATKSLPSVLHLGDASSLNQVSLFGQLYQCSNHQCGRYFHLDCLRLSPKVQDKELQLKMSTDWNCPLCLGIVNHSDLLSMVYAKSWQLRPHQSLWGQPPSTSLPLYHFPPNLLQKLLYPYLHQYLKQFRLFTIVTLEHFRHDFGIRGETNPQQPLDGKLSLFNTLDPLHNSKNATLNSNTFQSNCSPDGNMPASYRTSATNISSRERSNPYSDDDSDVSNPPHHSTNVIQNVNIYQLDHSPSFRQSHESLHPLLFAGDTFLPSISRNGPSSNLPDDIGGTVWLPYEQITSHPGTTHVCALCPRFNTFYPTLDRDTDLFIEQTVFDQQQLNAIVSQTPFTLPHLRPTLEKPKSNSDGSDMTDISDNDESTSTEPLDIFPGTFGTELQLMPQNPKLSKSLYDRNNLAFFRQLMGNYPNSTGSDTKPTDKKTRINIDTYNLFQSYDFIAELVESFNPAISQNNSPNLTPLKDSNPDQPEIQSYLNSVSPSSPSNPSSTLNYQKLATFLQVYNWSASSSAGTVSSVPSGSTFQQSLPPLTLFLQNTAKVGKKTTNYLYSLIKLFISVELRRIELIAVINKASSVKQLFSYFSDLDKFPQLLNHNNYGENTNSPLLSESNSIIPNQFIHFFPSLQGILFQLKNDCVSLSDDIAMTQQTIGINGCDVALDDTLTPDNSSLHGHDLVLTPSDIVEPPSQAPFLRASARLAQSKNAAIYDPEPCAESSFAYKSETDLTLRTAPHSLRISKASLQYAYNKFDTNLLELLFEYERELKAEIKSLINKARLLKQLKILHAEIAQNQLIIKNQQKTSPIIVQTIMNNDMDDIDSAYTVPVPHHNQQEVESSFEPVKLITRNLQLQAQINDLYADNSQLSILLESDKSNDPSARSSQALSQLQETFDSFTHTSPATLYTLFSTDLVSDSRLKYLRSTLSLVVADLFSLGRCISSITSSIFDQTLATGEESYSFFHSYNPATNLTRNYFSKHLTANQRLKLQTQYRSIGLKHASRPVYQPKQKLGQSVSESDGENSHGHTSSLPDPSSSESSFGSDGFDSDSSKPSRKNTNKKNKQPPPRALLSANKARGRPRKYPIELTGTTVPELAAQHGIEVNTPTTSNMAFRHLRAQTLPTTATSPPKAPPNYGVANQQPQLSRPPIVPSNRGCESISPVPPPVQNSISPSLGLSTAQLNLAAVPLYFKYNLDDIPQSLNSLLKLSTVVPHIPVPSSQDVFIGPLFIKKVNSSSTAKDLPSFPSDFHSVLARKRIEPVYVHLSCALWAPRVYHQGGNIQLITSEIQRARSMRCSYCNQLGGNLGCAYSRCQRSFHLQCAQNPLSGSFLHKTDFTCLCYEHYQAMMVSFMPYLKIPTISINILPNHGLSIDSDRLLNTYQSQTLSYPRFYVDVKLFHPMIRTLTSASSLCLGVAPSLGAPLSQHNKAYTIQRPPNICQRSQLDLFFHQLTNLSYFLLVIKVHTYGSIDAISNQSQLFPIMGGVGVPKGRGRRRKDTLSSPPPQSQPAKRIILDASDGDEFADVQSQERVTTTYSQSHSFLGLDWSRFSSERHEIEKQHPPDNYYFFPRFVDYLDLIRRDLQVVYQNMSNLLSLPPTDPGACSQQTPTEPTYAPTLWPQSLICLFGVLLDPHQSYWMAISLQYQIPLYLLTMFPFTFRPRDGTHSAKMTHSSQTEDLMKKWKPHLGSIKRRVGNLVHNHNEFFRRLRKQAYSAHVSTQNPFRSNGDESQDFSHESMKFTVDNNRLSFSGIFRYVHTLIDSDTTFFQKYPFVPILLSNCSPLLSPLPRHPYLPMNQQDLSPSHQSSPSESTKSSLKPFSQAASDPFDFILLQLQRKYLYAHEVFGNALVSQGRFLLNLFTQQDQQRKIDQLTKLLSQIPLEQLLSDPNSHPSELASENSLSTNPNSKDKTNAAALFQSLFQLVSKTSSGLNSSPSVSNNSNTNHSDDHTDHTSPLAQFLLKDWKIFEHFPDPVSLNSLQSGDHGDDPPAPNSDLNILTNQSSTQTDPLKSKNTMIDKSAFKHFFSDELLILLEQIFGLPLSRTSTAAPSFPATFIEPDNCPSNSLYYYPQTRSSYHVSLTEMDDSIPFSNDWSTFNSTFRSLPTSIERKLSTPFALFIRECKFMTIIPRFLHSNQFFVTNCKRLSQKRRTEAGSTSTRPHSYQPPLNLMKPYIGQQHLKDALVQSILLPLLLPNLYPTLGITPPKGLLITGPSGTGKSHIYSQLTVALDGLLIDGGDLTDPATLSSIIDAFHLVSKQVYQFLFIIVQIFTNCVDLQRLNMQYARGGWETKQEEISFLTTYMSDFLDLSHKTDLPIHLFQTAFEYGVFPFTTQENHTSQPCIVPDPPFDPQNNQLSKIPTITSLLTTASPFSVSYTIPATKLPISIRNQRRLFPPLHFLDFFTANAIPNFSNPLLTLNKLPPASLQPGCILPFKDLFSVYLTSFQFASRQQGFGEHQRKFLDFKDNFLRKAFEASHGNESGILSSSSNHSPTVSNSPNTLLLQENTALPLEDFGPFGSIQTVIHPTPNVEVALSDLIHQLPAFQILSKTLSRSEKSKSQLSKLTPGLKIVADKKTRDKNTFIVVDDDDYQTRNSDLDELREDAADLAGLLSSSLIDLVPNKPPLDISRPTIVLEEANKTVTSVNLKTKTKSTKKNNIIPPPPPPSKPLLVPTKPSNVSFATSPLNFFFAPRVTFIVRKATDLLSRYHGESEQTIVDIFNLATICQPAIIFIDEIDAIAPIRGVDKGQQVYSSLVTTLLACMDGLEQGNGINITKVKQANDNIGEEMTSLELPASSADPKDPNNSFNASTKPDQSSLLPSNIHSPQVKHHMEQLSHIFEQYTGPKKNLIEQLALSRLTLNEQINILSPALSAQSQSSSASESPQQPRELYQVVHDSIAKHCLDGNLRPVVDFRQYLVSLDSNASAYYQSAIQEAAKPQKMNPTPILPNPMTATKRLQFRKKESHLDVLEKNDDLIYKQNQAPTKKEALERAFQKVQDDAFQSSTHSDPRGISLPNGKNSINTCHTWSLQDYAFQQGLADAAHRIGSTQIFVIATTSLPQSIDPALRRPGRFDQEIKLFLPSCDDRREKIRQYIHHFHCLDDISSSGQDIPPTTTVHSFEHNLSNDNNPLPTKRSFQHVPQPFHKFSPQQQLVLLDPVSKLTANYTYADLELLCQQAFILSLDNPTQAQLGKKQGVQKTTLQSQFAITPSLNNDDSDDSSDEEYSLPSKRSAQTPNIMVIIKFSSFLQLLNNKSTTDTQPSSNRQTISINQIVPTAYDYSTPIPFETYSSFKNPALSHVPLDRQQLMNTTWALVNSLHINLFSAKTICPIFNTICFQFPSPQLHYPDPVMIIKLLQSSITHEPPQSIPPSHLPFWLFWPITNPTLPNDPIHPTAEIFTLTDQHFSTLRTISDIKALFQPVFNSLLASQGQTAQASTPQKLPHVILSLPQLDYFITSGSNGGSNPSQAANIDLLLYLLDILISLQNSTFHPYMADQSFKNEPLTHNICELVRSDSLSSQPASISQTTSLLLLLPLGPLFTTLLHTPSIMLTNHEFNLSQLNTKTKQIISFLSARCGQEAHVSTIARKLQQLFSTFHSLFVVGE
jgi:SpoVK/Ycf46/Vps4 family AAA+-type ATPase